MKTNNSLKGFYTSEDEQGSFYSISINYRGNKRAAALILASLIGRHNVRTVIHTADPFKVREDISRLRGWRVWRNLVSALTATCPVINITEDRINHKIVVNAKARDVRRGQLVTDQIEYVFE